MNHCSLKSNPVNIQSPETRPEYILLTWTFQKSRGPNHEVQQNAQVNSFQRTYMVFVSGLWIVAKLDFRDKWSVCNLDSVSNCLQHTQRSKKRKNSTKLSLWVLIIYFFDYRSSASSTTSPSCFFPIFWRVPGHYATIIHTILCIILWVVSRKCIFAAVISSEGIFFTICCLCSFFIRKNINFISLKQY